MWNEEDDDDALQPGNPPSLWDKIQSFFAPNNDFRAGMAPLGRNIYGEVGYVDTHFPQTRSVQIDPQAAWIDQDGNTATFSKSGNVYPLTMENWLNIIKPDGQEDFLSDTDYWRVINSLKEHGFFHKNEVPDNMQPMKPTQGVPMLLPVFFDSKDLFKSPNIDDGDD